MFQFRPDQVDFLQKWESGARFTALAGTDPEVSRCELLDNTHKKVWATGEAGDEEKALDDAIKNANPGDKPTTPAEAATQLKQYKEKYGELDTEPPAGPVEQVKPEDAAEEEPVEEHQMTAAEYRAALDARGLEAPDGNARSTAWKQAAMKMIREHDQAN